jgi:hypothetical protein
MNIIVRYNIKTKIEIYIDYFHTRFRDKNNLLIDNIEYSNCIFQTYSRF